jgi:Lon protease-like protein
MMRERAHHAHYDIAKSFSLDNECSGRRRHRSGSGDELIIIRSHVQSQLVVSMRIVASVAILLGVIQLPFQCSAWVSCCRPTRSSTALILKAAGSNNDDNQQREEGESEEDFKRRMAVVRALQMSYYSSADKEPSHLDKATGKLFDLPLWRVPWWEVPGRSNVLNVHEPIYTNMFETILYGPKPWCFGHLYLEGGSKNLKSEEANLQLETWETIIPTSAASAVIGCLMNISDYRRLNDGRLLLLVHAMERFVVTDVQQRLPYSIVNAQILPDAEEMDPQLDFGAYQEADLVQVRAMAIQESVRFHDYEYDPDHLLPVPDRPDMDVTDVLGSDIAKVLPFCPFSKTLEPPAPTTQVSIPPKYDTTDLESLPSLEYRLLCQGVFHTPLVDPEFTQRQDLTTDELEYELWLAINNYLIQTRTPVSPILLGLLPPSIVWPKEFVLKPIVQDLAVLDSMEHDFVLVSADYPVHRRQRRLSYSAAHLMETTADSANKLRPLLLTTPSTHQRLRLLLDRFDLWQEAKWGEFL